MALLHERGTGRGQAGHLFRLDAAPRRLDPSHEAEATAPENPGQYLLHVPFMHNGSFRRGSHGRIAAKAR
jgi:hypothetical protein